MGKHQKKQDAISKVYRFFIQQDYIGLCTKKADLTETQDNYYFRYYQKHIIYESETIVTMK